MLAKNRKTAILFLLITFAIPAISVTGAIDDKKIISRPSVFTSRSAQISSLRQADLQNLSEPGVSSVNGTVIFEEDFESASGFPPAGWKSVNADGGGSTGPWFAGNISVFTAKSGNSYAAANYQGANQFYIDEWFISPAISGLTSNDTLLFWHRSPDDSPWYDSLEVRISTSDTAISSFTNLVDYFKTSTGGWAQRRYPLAAYTGSGNPIYVAFRYLIYYGGSSGLNSDYVGIDLIQIVRPQVASDIRVLSIDNPKDGGKMTVNQPIAPVVNFQNAGSAEKSAIPVRLRIKTPTGSIYENNQVIPSLLPGYTSQIIFSNYIPAVTGIYTIKAFAYLPGDENPSNDSLGIITRSAVLLSGTFTVGVGGNIKSIKSAVDTLNHNLISGDVTLTLVDRVYNEPPLSLGSLDYISSAKRVLIKPSGTASPTINIQATIGEQFGIAFGGTAFVTFDGSNSIQNNRSTTIRVTGEYAKIGILMGGTDQSFADSNVIKNLKIESGADSLSDANGYYGILLLGFSPALRDYGNIISNCEVTRHGSAGIAAQWQEGVVIEKNYIHDWHQVAGDNNVHGIMNGDGARRTVIRGNIIGNIRSAGNYTWAVGIENNAGEGSNVSVYNNIVYNVLAYGSGGNTNRSIGLFGSSYFNGGDKYCYNSIYLSGTDLSSSALSRTAGIELAGGSNLTVVNNIIFNESVLSGSAEENRAFGIYLSGYHNNFVSNNNIFYIPSAQGVVGYNEGIREVLTEWQASFDPEQDEESEMGDPQFISKTTGNLHINSSVSSPANSAGAPVEGIVTDIDRNPRNAVSPDIGADEFIPGGTFVQQTYPAGWNLVSVPVIVENYEVTVLFPGSISEAFGYQGSYTATEFVENGQAYWLKFDQQAFVGFMGLPLTADTIQVVRGWNLIGSITDTVSTSSIVEIPSGIALSDYYYHNGGYTAVDVLLPGRGYWVKMDREGELILR